MTQKKQIVNEGLTRRHFIQTGASTTVAASFLPILNLRGAGFAAQHPPNQPAATNFRLPDESTGIDGIARTLISVFDQADIVALGEAHQRKLDSDLRIALVRHPDFARKVRSIVVEFASTTEQPTLDRYIRGESVSRAQLEQVWKTTEARPPTESGTLPFTRTFSQPSVRSIRSCQPMREFASSEVTPDQETTVAATPPPFPF